MYVCGGGHGIPLRPADESTIINGSVWLSGLKEQGYGLSEEAREDSVRGGGLFIMGVAVLIALAGGLPARAGWDDVERREVAMTAEDFAKLDTFEGHQLAKADKVFAAKDFRGATAEYSAFLEQYPKSPATAYALLRKGRSLQWDNKRFEAIKVFTEVLDYFPNSVNYAAAALFYTGQCHLQNDDAGQAVKAWTEMVQDEDYRKHSLAAVALYRLAEEYMRQNKPDDAVKFYVQAAVDFRRANQEVSWYALERAVYCFVRVHPDEAKLAEFYKQVSTFHPGPDKTSEWDYWASVRANIRKYGTFGDTEGEKKKKVEYYRYWAGVMEGKRPSDDEFQLDLAEFERSATGDIKKWVERLDHQYAQFAKTNDHSRTIRWIREFGGMKDKVQEYYGKLNFAEMSNGQIEALLVVAYENVRDAAMGRNVYDKFQQDKLTDADRGRLIDFFYPRDEVMVVRACEGLSDKDAGRMRLLRYYHWRGNVEKGLPLADDLTKVPAYAKDAYWMKGELLERAGKLPEAISAYQACDRPPATLYKIADCYRRLGKTDQAVQQLREIENFFEKEAAEAALRIAFIYRDKKDTKQYVASLRGILKKYPASGQSSVAHEELERMGFKIGGGVDAQ